MQNKSILISLVIVCVLSIVFVTRAYSQTEGFNVKTPIQKIADSSTKFLNQIANQTKKNPTKSVPQDLACSSTCFLVIPDIDIIPSRGDFTGTGILSCRVPDSVKFTEPIYYKINNLNSFNEGGGGILILATSSSAMKTLLGDNVHISSDNTSAGKVGSSKDAVTKPFVAFAKYKDGLIEGIDLSGSILEYSSRDTFNAYQGTIVPIEILVAPQDVPPILREFGSSLTEWAKTCK